MRFFTALLFALACTVPTFGQDSGQSAEAMDSEKVRVNDSKNEDSASMSDVGDQAKELASQTKEKVGELAKTLDQTEAAKSVSAGLLKPVYRLADSLSFPSFYWVAFMLMVAGTTSYTGQLIFGKVVVLANGSMNVREILSDSIALVICLIGLVLTTQAATQNSTFPSTPSAVLSSTVVGAILGLCLYRWGQAEEVDAARGRKAAKSKS